MSDQPQPSRIAWRRWKLGLVVALIMSLLVACAGLTEDMGWRAFLAVFGAAAVTHLTTFLYQHPVEQIDFDEEKGKP